VADQITLSPTRIKRWVRCRKSYHWRYNQQLVKIHKDYPLTLGTVVSESLAGYYIDQPRDRDQDSLISVLASSLIFCKPGPDAKKEVTDAWRKVASISQNLLEGYHEWASERDNFDVVMIETPRDLELTPRVHLLAIPDTVVIRDGSQFILEHKVRSRYHLGDFNLDYQSVGSCLVTGSMGTIYNVLEYSKTKYHRTILIRDEYELDYFQNMFIHIGEDILRTPPEDLYPTPMGRCHCEYFELCNAEQTGLDIEDIIEELYVKSIKPRVEKEPEE